MLKKLTHMPIIVDPSHAAGIPELVKRIGKRLPKTWCYCTLCCTNKMFEFVYDSEVDVELLESVKQGDNRCVIKIERIVKL